MHQDVTKYTLPCSACQQIKYLRRTLFGLLQPIPPPTAIWEDGPMNFIVFLPAHQGNTVIIVVIDHFPKQGTLEAYLPILACKAAELFTNSSVKCMATREVSPQSES